MKLTNILKQILKERTNIQELSPELRKRASSAATDKFFKAYKDYKASGDPDASDSEVEKRNNQSNLFSSIPNNLKKEGEAIADELAKANETSVSGVVLRKERNGMIKYSIAFNKRYLRENIAFSVYIAKNLITYGDTTSNLEIPGDIKERMYAFFDELKKEL